ncbi:F0F1 ATP synthase subunit B [Candidatus Bipolaricaulota bacterium]|nr:F0F1 ATP synthase subunit B [Candidatus Bipolaricaulota bacterium]
MDLTLELGKVIRSINWTFIFTLLNFALLVYLMKRILFKPALAYIDRRREQIASRMEAARKSEATATALVAQREEELKATHEQARRTIDDATARAERIVSAATGDAKKEAERILAAARRRIAQERTQMEADLRRAYAEIAVLGAARVLDREIRIEDHQRLLDTLIDEIDEQALMVKR